MSYRKLGRTSSQRKALLRDLTTSLIVNGSITTTEPRAKEVRKTMDQMITLAKKGDLASRRKAAAFVRNVVADVKEDGDDIKINPLCKTCLRTLHRSTLTVTVVTLGSSRPCRGVGTVPRWLSWNLSKRD